MNRQEFSAVISATFEKLQKSIDAFSYTTFNKVPFDGSWTAGQIVQHVVLVAGGFADMLFGKVAKADRPTDQWVKSFEETFENLELRMDSPEQVVPQKRTYQLDEFNEELLKIAKKLKKAVEDLDLDELCMDFEVPVSGYLTRKEALTFALYHTKRHQHQLETEEKLVNFAEDTVFKTIQVFNVNREKLFEAWTSPEILKKWWGPHGFTNTIEQYDLRAGGQWILTMHGPDGRDFDNHSEFIRIDRPKLITWFRHTAPFFKTIVEFKELGSDQTELRWDMIFKDAHTVNQMRDFLLEKNNENLERLKAVLAEQNLS